MLYIFVNILDVQLHCDGLPSESLVLFCLFHIFIVMSIQFSQLLSLLSNSHGGPFNLIHKSNPKEKETIVKNSPLLVLNPIICVSRT